MKKITQLQKSEVQKTCLLNDMLLKFSLVDMALLLRLFASSSFDEEDLWFFDFR